MSEKLGPLLYNENQQEVFLGHSVTQRQNMSEATAQMIDEEVRRIVTDGEKRAWDYLLAHKEQLEAIAQALMEYETISGEECETLMRGEKISRPSDDDANQGPLDSAVPVAGHHPAAKHDDPDPDTSSMEPQPS